MDHDSKIIHVWLYVIAYDICVFSYSSVWFLGLIQVKIPDPFWVFNSLKYSCP